MQRDWLPKRCQPYLPGHLKSYCTYVEWIWCKISKYGEADPSSQAKHELFAVLCEQTDWFNSTAVKRFVVDCQALSFISTQTKIRMYISWVGPSVKMIPSKFSSLAPQHSKQWQCGHCHGWSIFVHQVRFQVRYRHGAPRLEASKYTARYAAGGICNMHGYAKICKRSTHAEIEAECSSSTCKGRKMGWIVDDNGFEDLC